MPAAPRRTPWPGGAGGSVDNLDKVDRVYGVDWVDKTKTQRGWHSLLRPQSPPRPLPQSCPLPQATRSWPPTLPWFLFRWRAACLTASCPLLAAAFERKVDSLNACTASARMPANLRDDQRMKPDNRFNLLSQSEWRAWNPVDGVDGDNRVQNGAACSAAPFNYSLTQLSDESIQVQSSFSDSIHEGFQFSGA